MTSIDLTLDRPQPSLKAPAPSGGPTPRHPAPSPLRQASDDLAYRPAGRSRTGLAVVIGAHVLLGWALVSGLARDVVEIVKAPLETRLIEELKPPPPPPPPPVERQAPPKAVKPPPAYVPPP